MSLGEEAASGLVPPPQIPAKVQLGEEIADYVRDLIMSGQLRAGDPVPMDVLARQIGTSVSPVREALLLLHGEGFVVRVARKGFRVAPLTGRDVQDLYLVQGMLSGELAARAVQRGGAELADAIAEIQERLKAAAAAEDPQQVERLNGQFHRTLNAAAASPKLSWLLALSMRYVPSRFFATIPSWSRASSQDHDAIVVAAQNAQPEAARTAMANHIVHAGDLLVAHLSARGFWADPSGSRFGRKNAVIEG